ncbi:MAG: Rdx family protein [Gammaproteobacteria bacterium]|nr:Rdx family protein [Gammaproteobacteria bacterium]
MDAAFATTTVLIEGGGGIFDVRVDGNLIYSKHQTGRFPAEDMLLEEMRAR